MAGEEKEVWLKNSVMAFIEPEGVLCFLEIMNPVSQKISGLWNG